MKTVHLSHADYALALRKAWCDDAFLRIVGWMGGAKH